MDKVKSVILDRIYDFIIENSKGNFSLQLDPKESGDFEPLILLLNMMSEELNILIHHLHGAKSTSKTINLIFIFDRSLQIKFLSKSVYELLKLRKNILDQKTSLNDLLASKSIKKIKKSMVTSRTEKIPVDFIYSPGIIIETMGSVESLPMHIGPGLFLLKAHKILEQNKRLEKLLNSNRIVGYPTKNRSLLLQENREMIERIEEYIIKNIDQPFPGLAELASFSNASESKIKKGFKLHYGMTIYQYYTKKRHEKALLLLTQTEKQVSTVAMECGFINAAHFSRSFKKYFGISPSQVQRRPDNI